MQIRTSDHRKYMSNAGLIQPSSALNNYHDSLKGVGDESNIHTTININIEEKYPFCN